MSAIFVEFCNQQNIKLKQIRALGARVLNKTLYIYVILILQYPKKSTWIRIMGRCELVTYSCKKETDSEE